MTKTLLACALVALLGALLDSALGTNLSEFGVSHFSNIVHKLYWMSSGLVIVKTIG